MNTQNSKAKAIESIDAAAETARTVQRQAGATVEKGFEQTVSAIKTGVADATANFETTQAKFKEQVEKAMKTAEELVAFGQGNVEAFVKSGQIWAAGVQDISKQVAANAQASLDETLSVFKRMGAVRSLKEAMDLQAGLARTSLEKAMSETGRLTDASFKLAEQTLAPIAARMSMAVEKFGRAA